MFGWLHETSPCRRHAGQPRPFRRHSAGISLKLMRSQLTRNTCKSAGILRRHSTEGAGTPQALRRHSGMPAETKGVNERRHAGTAGVSLRNPACLRLLTPHPDRAPDHERRTPRPRWRFSKLFAARRKIMSPGPVADHERSAELVAEIVRLDHATPGLARTVVA